jgi:hypothetical protein
MPRVGPQEHDRLRHVAAASIWECPSCKEPIDQPDAIAVSRHHDWHRLIDRQRTEREISRRTERAMHL